MCGIAGIVSTTASVATRDRVRRMTDCLVHRGPDDAGEYTGPGVALGFRRLAIIDLSPAGHQPMTNEDETVWLIFNGEIYNYQDLRKDLERAGHRFRSATDSETVIHAYEEYGEACVERFHGMFAFAVWDAKEKKLFLARDRFGKKPLFYHQKGESLFFGSELSALLSVVERPTMNERALRYYFRLQFIPSPHTIYQGIQKLPPAHTLTWQHGQSTVRRFWSLHFTPKTTMSIEDASREFEKRFRTSLKRRLMSDVPLGVFLSGGLDSSIITALMAEYLDEPVKTFSIGFAEESHNELPLARLVAERYRTDHHEFIVQPDVVEILPKLMQHYGEPFADSSAIATYCVARETRQHVTVALTGDGGDENFGGYEKYALLASLSRFDALPGPLRRFLTGWIGSLGGLLPGTLARKARIGSHLAAGDFLERYNDLFFVFQKPELASLLTNNPVVPVQDDAETLGNQLIADLGDGAPLTDRITALDLRLYLPEGLMTKADIATMANSLEARAPFLDHTVVEFTATLPAAYKVTGGQQKVLLRRQFGHLLPPPLLVAKKHGFDLPVNAWLRGRLRSYLQEQLFDASFRALPCFNHNYIKRLVMEHMENKAHHGIKLWSLLCFAVWQKGGGQ